MRFISLCRFFTAFFHFRTPSSMGSVKRAGEKQVCRTQMGGRKHSLIFTLKEVALLCIGIYVYFLPHISPIPFPFYRLLVLMSLFPLLYCCWSVLGFFVGINKGCAEWEWGYFYSYVSFFRFYCHIFLFYLT